MAMVLRRRWRAVQRAGKSWWLLSASTIPSLSASWACQERVKVEVCMWSCVQLPPLAT